MRPIRSCYWQYPAGCLGLALVVSGCAGPAHPGHAGLPDSHPAPAYAYPDAPPLVDRAALESLLIRLDSDRTVLWVFHAATQHEAAVAAALADQRNTLRATGVEIVALWAGPSPAWRCEVLPMLRKAGACFPCAASSPPGAAGLAVWLAGDPGRPPAGLYLLDRSSHAVNRLETPADNLASVLTGPAAHGYVGDPALSAGAQTLVRVRLVDVETGQVLARASAQAAAPADLAAELTRQLAAAGHQGEPVAVCPLRRIQGTPAGDGSATIEDLLAEGLSGLGWPQVIPPDQAGQALVSLGLADWQIEFDPTQLAGRTPWKTVVIGSLEPAQRGGR